MNLDTTVQVRLRRTDLATALLALESQGRRPLSLSAIVRDIFEAGVYSMVQGGALEITDTDKAMTLLKQFKASGNPRGRGLKNLSLNVLQQEEADSEATERQFQLKETNKVQNMNEQLDKLSEFIADEIEEEGGE